MSKSKIALGKYQTAFGGLKAFTKE